MFTKAKEDLARRVAANVLNNYKKSKKVKPKKNSILKQIIDNPDEFELTARVENGGVTIRINKLTD